MANTDAKRDANHVPVMLGKGDSGETLPVKIDHVTGRILAEIYYVPSISSTTVNRAFHDANHATTITGIDNTGALRGVLINSSNGAIDVDLVIE